jgi:hypothetical protein
MNKVVPTSSGTRGRGGGITRRGESGTMEESGESETGGSWIGPRGQGYGEPRGTRRGENSRIWRGQRDVKELGQGFGSDMLNVDYNVIWVLGEDDVKASCLCVFCF